MASEAREEIEKLVRDAEALIKKAQEISDESGEEFHINIGGYGMGGWYESGEWMASSQSC